MNKKQTEILKVILKDVETLNLDLTIDSNRYYYNLIVGNLTDLIKGEKQPLNEQEEDIILENARERDSLKKPRGLGI